MGSSILDVGIDGFWLAFVKFMRGEDDSSHPADAFAKSFSIKAPNGGGGKGTVWTEFVNSLPFSTWHVLGGKVARILQAWSRNGSKPKESAAVEEAMHWYNMCPNPKPGPSRAPTNVSNQLCGVPGIAISAKILIRLQR